MFSLVGPQISQKFHATADTELESEGDGHGHEFPPTEEESASKTFLFSETEYKACRLVMKE